MAAGKPAFITETPAHVSFRRPHGMASRLIAAVTVVGGRTRLSICPYGRKRAGTYCCGRRATHQAQFVPCCRWRRRLDHCAKTYSPSRATEMSQGLCPPAVKFRLRRRVSHAPSVTDTAYKGNAVPGECGGAVRCSPVISLRLI